MKRVITILLLTLLLCSTSISVFAIPTNEITIELPVEVSARFDNGLGGYNVIDSSIWYYSLNDDNITPPTTGNIYYHAFTAFYKYPLAQPGYTSHFYNLTYTISLPGNGDVVIALPSTTIPISKPEQNMDVTMGVNILLDGAAVSFTKLYSETVSSVLYGLDYDLIHGDLRSVDFGPSSIDLTYYRISGVSLGEILEVKVGYNGLYQFLQPDDNSPVGKGLPFGAFVSNYEGVDLFGSWTDPNDSFSHNVDNISNVLDFAIHNTTSVTERIFFAGFAEYQLNNLVASSDAAFVEEAAAFNSTLDDIITDMNSRAANVNGYRAALSRFSDEYVIALQKADTPEQGDYITALYQAKQQQLTNNAVINSTHAVQRVISQEELDTVTELDQLEESMFSELTVQRLQDTLDYNLWFNRLDAAEAMTYRSIFDYFLNTAAWAYWIVVPMTFLIVSALLGTVIRVAGRPSRSSTGRPSRSSRGG